MRKTHLGPKSDEIGEPWPERFVDGSQPIPKSSIRFQDVVDAAQDERPIQDWLKRNPFGILSLLGGKNRAWVWDRPRFGAECIPDFMLSAHDSRGYEWHLVEIENPQYPLLTQLGERTAKLTHAVQQIDDWRIWIRQNIEYAQHQLGYVDLDADFHAYIVLGRRQILDDEMRKRYRQLSHDKLTIMTYDRLIEQVEHVMDPLRHYHPR